VLVAILVLLLIGAAAGVLGAVLKAALVLVLALILTVFVLVAGSYYYLRYRVRRFIRESDPRYRPMSGQGRGYPTRGSKRPRPDQELPG
jgi:membrane protein implicated in regulation of membrane protease activity